MVDNLKPEDRKKTMQAVKGKGTSLERRLFSILASMRFRGWKKNASDVVGKPDVVFATKRVAIFVDGCFWHGCPYCKRTLPETNREYWKRKIRRNVTLAKRHNRQLLDDGWAVIRIWEHEMREPFKAEEIKLKIRLAIRKESKPNEPQGKKHQASKSASSRRVA